MNLIELIANQLQIFSFKFQAFPKPNVTKYPKKIANNP